MKRINFFLIITALFLVLLAPSALAAESGNLYFFYGDGCPHCANEEAWLEQLVSEHPGIKVRAFEVWQNRTNQSLMREVGKALDADISGVPLTVVGDNYLIGFLNAQTTGGQIENFLDRCEDLACQDVVGQIIQEKFTKPGANQNQNTNSNPKPEEEKESLLPETIGLPLFGEIEVRKFSLPILTVIIAALAGFNPCAMWVLLFLISLLLGMANRKRMWILGSAFIIASAAVYFAFMVAWLNILLFLGLILWIRIIIGLVALSSGGYHLKEWWVNREAYCKVTGSEKRQRIFAKLKEITQNQKFILALGGIILLAFAVNLVEAICSAGLPVVFTQILTLSDLSSFSHYAYILLYIFIFMLDDLLVFIIAMVTLKAVGVTSRFSRASNLIGGLVMLILGILLIFKPEWLMFG